jgi:hypothetical protein
VVIDDCSPLPVSDDFRRNNLDIYRVDHDIPWNIAGARNLAFHVAKTPWVLCADIDHVVTKDALTAILQLDLTDHNVAYTFQRKKKNGEFGCLATINILMSRDKYFEIGGHDEDFSGHYGREETFFSKCLKRAKLRLVHREEIILDWYPNIGGTQGLVRNKDLNGLIYERKMQEFANNAYVNGNILRFPWHSVMDERVTEGLDREASNESL